MSWDIFVQDLPDAITSIREIPDHFRPRQDICRRDEVVAAVMAIAPSATFEENGWGSIDGPNLSIDVNLGNGEVLDGFAFHVRGNDGAAARAIISEILGILNLRAIDVSATSGLFDEKGSAEGFRRWREYRDSVIARE
ncbi:MAG: hypothetical protein JWQ98_835 [Chlorobi bacterium]|nr:hypothetical protein [Chlorobiota bacterium]